MIIGHFFDTMEIVPSQKSTIKKQNMIVYANSSSLKDTIIFLATIKVCEILCFNKPYCFKKIITGENALKNGVEMLFFSH
jgi:hypothetical protein